MQVQVGKVLKVKLRADDFQAGDELEVFCIVGGDIEAEMEGGGTDDEVLEWDDYAVGGLFAFNLTGGLGDFNRNGIGVQIVQNFVHKCKTAETIAVCSGSVYTVG